MTPVKPIVPPAPWLGGKRNLAGRLTAILDAIPCQTYAEPFLGLGGIFFRRRMRPRAEVINDFGRDVANLFRILQRHYPQFLDTLKFQLTTRAEFERLAGVLAGVKARFVMSINDVPEIREVFGRFDLTEVETSYTVGSKAGSRGKRGELVVRNG